MVGLVHYTLSIGSNPEIAGRENRKPLNRNSQSGGMIGDTKKMTNSARLILIG